MIHRNFAFVVRCVYLLNQSSGIYLDIQRYLEQNYSLNLAFIEYVNYYDHESVSFPFPSFF